MAVDIDLAAVDMDSPVGMQLPVDKDLPVAHMELSAAHMDLSVVVHMAVLMLLVVDMAVLRLVVAMLDVLAVLDVLTVLGRLVELQLQLQPYVLSSSFVEPHPRNLS